MRNGLLFSKVREGKDTGEIYVVLNEIGKALVIRYHDLSSHFGVEKTVKGIDEFYHFPEIKRYDRVHFENCVQSFLAKRKSGLQAGEPNPNPPGKGSFEVVHIDTFLFIDFIVSFFADSKEKYVCI